MFNFNQTTASKLARQIPYSWWARNPDSYPEMLAALAKRVAKQLRRAVLDHQTRGNRRQMLREAMGIIR